MIETSKQTPYNCSNHNIQTSQLMEYCRVLETTIKKQCNVCMESISPNLFSFVSVAECSGSMPAITTSVQPVVVLERGE